MALAESSTRKEVRRLPLLDQMLDEQRALTAVERFSQYHDGADGHLQAQYYKTLLPSARPEKGQQYAFEVNLDVCSGCKACVTACHRLNGLEPEETWRSVGLLHGMLRDAKGKQPVQKTVTTACHHCVDPACMKGCPVKAYEKDPVTGIVKHLDDQCIGCQYCILACPYEVPQYSEKKGIVRKCDMCTDRLAEGEAPACVQACPNQAIAIRVIDIADAKQAAIAGDFLPGAPAPSITTPTTRYVSSKPLPADLTPGDLRTVTPAHGHTPLVGMLVLTQLAAGAFAALTVLPYFLGERASALLLTYQSAFALLAVFAGLGASTAHLGRPQYAFRAILGLRTSWLSREVLAFGIVAKLALVHALLVHRARVPLVDALLPRELDRFVPVVGAALAVSALGAVLTSVMLYHVTQRSFWNVRRTAFKFYGSVVVLGTAASALCLAASELTESGVGTLRLAHAFAVVVPALALAKLIGETRIFEHRDAEPVTDLSRTVMLLDGALHPLWGARIGLALAGGIILPLFAAVVASSALALTVTLSVSLVLLIGGELCERMLFFTAMSSMRMPGGLK